MAAERDAKNLLALEWIKGHIGETFPAVVSGLTRGGLFVQMDEKLIEGFVPIEDLPGDWRHDDATMRCLRAAAVARFHSVSRSRCASRPLIRRAQSGADPG